MAAADMPKGNFRASIRRRATVRTANTDAIKNGYGECPARSVPAGHCADMGGSAARKQVSRGRQDDHDFAPLWDELFPAEQARIVRLLIERVVLAPDGMQVRRGPKASRRSSKSCSRGRRRQPNARVKRPF
jgi:hypothetical protein